MTSRLLPGGASAEERWTSPSEITIDVRGDVGATDRNAVIDWVTAWTLEGARRIVLHRNSTHTLDPDAERTLLRLREYMARIGGALIVHVDDERAAEPATRTRR